jgi:AraC-like DNA-binding protein
MRIAMLARNANLYSPRRRVEAAQARDHEIQVINTLRVYMNITSHRPEVYCTNFQTVLDSLRSSLARNYLEQRQYGIKEIAFLLGYSDAATFSRAFRRWTGTTPGRYAHEVLRPLGERN